jgi:hypothetical protein
MFNESPKVLTTKIIKEMVETKIDTRTFGEIYQSLNEMTQFDLREKIKSLSYCTEAAIRNWRNGHRRPEPVHQANIVKALKTIGIRTSPATLFPKR